jgi:hypothetical protein
MAARLSALRAGRTLPPGFFIFKDSWYSFLLEAESTPGPVRPEGLGQTANGWRHGCQPYAPAALYPQVSLFLKIPGTHFC